MALHCLGVGPTEEANPVSAAERGLQYYFTVAEGRARVEFERFWISAETRRFVFSCSEHTPWQRQFAGHYIEHSGFLPVDSSQDGGVSYKINKTRTVLAMECYSDVTEPRDRRNEFRLILDTT